MKVKQNLAVLFYHFNGKQNQNGVPIYIRVTNDGDEAEMSLGRRILQDLKYWA